MKKTYVIDTNVILSDSDVIFKFGSNDIVIPFIVLQEIDNFKNKLGLTGVHARKFIREMELLRTKGNFSSGIRIQKRKGLLFVKNYNKDLLKSNFSEKVSNDDKIICVALEELKENKNVILISKDINVRIKCNSLGIISEDYQLENIANKREELYSGFVEYLIDEQIIDDVYSGKSVYLDKKEITLYPNQFVMLISNSNNKKSVITRFTDYNKPLQKMKDYKKVFGLVPKNKEQSMALDLLLDANIDLVTLSGTSGVGKTLISIAAGLELVLQQKKYKKIIIIRPMISVGKEIGFLPGSLDEKLAPWISPITDNLVNLLGDDGKNILEDYKRSGLIEIECLSFIRGRSISDAYIFIDEIQNLSLHEVKTIITRVGNNTKIILNGDVQQIDSVYLNEYSNGLTNLIEKVKQESITGHITLKKGERSRIANLGATLL